MTYEDAVRALSTGAYTPAIATFLGRVSHDRRDGRAWMYLGIAYSEIGYQDEALSALFTANELMEGDAELSEALGCTYLRLQRFEAAQQHLVAATRFGDCSASVYRNLAILFLKTERLGAALAAIDTAHEMDGDDVLTLFGKALVLEAIGKSSSRSVEAEMRTVLRDIMRRRDAPSAIVERAEVLIASLGDQRDESHLVPSSREGWP